MKSALSRRLRFALMAAALSLALPLRAQPTGAPDAPAQAQPPEVEAQFPKVEAQSPEVEAQSPEVEAQPPEVEAQPPEVEAQSPEVEAQPPEVEAQPPEVEAPETEEAAEAEAPEAHSATVRSQRTRDTLSTEERATERIDRAQMRERQVRSTPDALRYTPGVFIQQTGHGQASPYIRGRTGQHTLLLFDGLRINHALFRQGPNQYLFTVDANTLESVDVLRGSASVLLGADAMSGAVLLQPRDPTIDPAREGLFHIIPALRGRYASADGEIGGRVEIDTQVGPSTGLLLGYGQRKAGLLEASGDVGHLVSADDIGIALFQKEVPTFKEDGRTQMGTGFGERTFDARLVQLLPHNWGRLTAAGYFYRQSDAPRTDMCPPPEHNLTECLIYKEQNRSQAYLKAQLTPRWIALQQADINLGWQRQFEHRERDSSEILGSITGGRDQIDIWGLRVAAATPAIPLYDQLRLKVEYGLDGSQESVDSTAYTELVRVNVTREAPRAQYLSDSQFMQGGVYLHPRLYWGSLLTLRGGMRMAKTWVDVPEHEESATRAIRGGWSSSVYNAGLDIELPWDLSLVFNYEQGYRPPNLDDLTGRQLTGRGLQIENAALRPERAHTYEMGLRWRWPKRVNAQLWVFHQQLKNLLERREGVCPENNRECRTQRSTPIQLVNLPGDAWIRGLEAVAEAHFKYGFQLRATIAYAKGEGSHPLPQIDERMPLSRIPPLNGTAELSWRDPNLGIYAGAAMRWAADQDRISLGDQEDIRIPFGGTPGYRVFDARAGYHNHWLSVSAVFENLSDTPNRTHGSAINGPARGLQLSVELRYD